VLADEVREGQRGAAAGSREAEGSMSIRAAIRVLSAIGPGVGSGVLDHRVVDQASGVDSRGLQLTGPLLRVMYW